MARPETAVTIFVLWCVVETEGRRVAGGKSQTDGGPAWQASSGIKYELTVAKPVPRTLVLAPKQAPKL
jgi:hypothetical protein